MDIAKFFHPFRLFAAVALVVALLPPYIAGAVGIGEIVLQSKLGEPLFVQVGLMTASGENVEESCLSLAEPDPQDDEARNYLRKAKLEIKTEGARRYVVISSHKPFNELFAKLRLQVNCPGIGSIIKTLTFLPDLSVISPPATNVPVSTTAEASDSNAPAGAPDRNAQMENAAQQPAHDESSARTGAGEDTLQAAPPARKRHAQTSRRKLERQATFRLKLSGEPIDESRIGKISPEERNLLLARQKLLDADDQMASFLALQHQVKQLQDELGEIKLKLATLDRSPSAAAMPVAGALGKAAAPAGDKPAIAVKDVTLQNDTLQLGLLAAGLMLLITALLLLLRRHTRLKSQQAAKPLLGQSSAKEEPAVIPLVSPYTAATVPATPVPATPVRAIPVSATPPPTHKEEQAVAPPKIITPKEALPQYTQPKIEKEEVTEESSMLEEAELYAVHGRPDKAIEILHEITARNPAHTEAQMLLISILSSLSRVDEFEKAAREFLKYNKDSESWKMVQTLGRTLDQSNPLYTGDGNPGIAAIFMPQMAANKVRPVGDILIEMGALSAQDMKNCLADFKPKVHGRFGGYLISRKVITLAQLNQALLKQHGADTPGVLPTLQDMESFLADYDPERDGNVGEFLVARKAITHDQLNNTLQQPDGDDTDADTAPTPTPTSSPAAASDKDKPLDWEWTKFHLP